MLSTECYNELLEALKKLQVGEFGIGVAPSGFIRLDKFLIHALTGVAIQCRPFGSDVRESAPRIPGRAPGFATNVTCSEVT